MEESSIDIITDINAEIIHERLVENRAKILLVLKLEIEGTKRRTMTCTIIVVTIDITMLSIMIKIRSTTKIIISRRSMTETVKKLTQQQRHNKTKK